MKPIEPRPMKSKNSKGLLTQEDRINAEFKHLRKRIKRLEDLLLNQVTDSGLIIDDVKNLNKG